MTKYQYWFIIFYKNRFCLSMMFLTYSHIDIHEYVIWCSSSVSPQGGSVFVLAQFVFTTVMLGTKGHFIWAAQVVNVLKKHHSWRETFHNATDEIIWRFLCQLYNRHLYQFNENHSVLMHSTLMKAAVCLWCSSWFEWAWC